MAGVLTVDALDAGTITINDHIITGGSTPTAQLQTVAGQYTTITAQHNAAPRIVLTLVGKTNARAVGYVDQVDTSGFMIEITSAQDNQTYVFSYQVMQ